MPDGTVRYKNMKGEPLFHFMVRARNSPISYVYVNDFWFRPRRARSDTVLTPYALIPNTVELIPTLGALSPRGGPVQDPVLAHIPSTRIAPSPLSLSRARSVSRSLSHTLRPYPEYSRANPYP